MPAIAVPPPSQPADPPRARVADPAYTALRLAAGSLVFLGTESTASVSTLRLAGR
ncbi:hypothetical protein N8K70_03445 [Microbacterium betulae]|uniref:Uncharacterized protein n=1 Tax=Microbacterium betulae TaxID=2981139 RepID=A0AA97I5H5_9MICO|nr:hypothetical protein [Microbacterium sp. AB]WOF23746.1 hypothetical protein N8K70_03445 [Microbacterium sp. AB]